MTNMEYLKEYIEFQTLDTEDDVDTVSIFYLRASENDVAEQAMNINFAIEKTTVNLHLSEEEAVKLIDQYLTDFSETVDNNTMAIERAKINVKKKSRRASANKNYKNSWFYAGTKVYDRPVLVAEHNGKYAVMKHPDFDNYGFIVK